MLMGAGGMRGEQKRFDIVDARERFDAYTRGLCSLSTLWIAVTDSLAADGSDRPALVKRAASDPIGHRKCGSAPSRHSTDEDHIPPSNNPFEDHSLWRGFGGSCERGR
ncbi:MAG: hypothetical protein WBM40_09320 [Thiohalocapsa sp.]